MLDLREVRGGAVRPTRERRDRHALGSALLGDAVREMDRRRSTRLHGAAVVWYIDGYHLPSFVLSGLSIGIPCEDD